jgi:hypothetical protein
MSFIEHTKVLHDFEGNPLYDKPEFEIGDDGKPDRQKPYKDRKQVTLGSLIISALMAGFPPDPSKKDKESESAEQKMDDFALAMRFTPNQVGRFVEVSAKEQKRLIEVVNRLSFNKIFVAQALHMISTAPHEAPASAAHPAALLNGSGDGHAQA